MKLLFLPPSLTILTLPLTLSFLQSVLAAPQSGEPTAKTVKDYSKIGPLPIQAADYIKGEDGLAAIARISSWYMNQGLCDCSGDVHDAAKNAHPEKFPACEYKEQITHQQCAYKQVYEGTGLPLDNTAYQVCCAWSPNSDSVTGCNKARANGLNKVCVKGGG